MTISYTFNGTVEKNYYDWDKWISDAVTICEALDQKINYYGIIIVGKNPGGIRPIAGLKRTINNAKDKGAEIKGITLLVLPDGFESAAFDYIITLSRYGDYLTLIINQEYEIFIKEKLIIDILRRNINVSSGEVYEMDISECPELYAAKANSKDSFKSLRLIKKL